MKLKTKEQLPFKYFVVKNDKSQDFIEYIQWINKEYKDSLYGWDTNAYYGYDGSNLTNRNHTVICIHKNISNFENNPKVFTAKEFMDILREEKISDKKIIAYKAPYDLFNGAVKKDFPYVLLKGFDKAYPKGLENTHYGIPKELVETWEPVYETKEVIVSMGEFNLKVTPDGIFHKSENITIFVSNLVEWSSNNTISRHGNYSVIRKDIIFSQTGCEHSETKLSQWIEVWNTYKKLKN